MLLTTHDLRLEPLELSHTANLFQLVDQNRAHLREWLPWVDLTTREQDSRNFIYTSLKKHAAGTDRFWAIHQNANLTGMIGLHKINADQASGEIGYWLGADHQGQGIITHACREVIAFAINHLSLIRIEIICEQKNLRSRAVPERLGFQGQESGSSDSEHLVYFLENN